MKIHLIGDWKRPFFEASAPKTKNIHTRVICYLKLNQLPLYHIPTQKKHPAPVGKYRITKFLPNKFLTGLIPPQKKQKTITNKQEAKLPMMTVRGIVYLKKRKFVF